MEQEKMKPEGKVLIVDDDPDILLYLSEFIDSKGYTTLTASCGKEALEKLERDHPDLVLLDVMMPDMDGFEVCRRIRANPATALLPVVMVTGAGPQERVKGIEAEADDFFVKPGDRHELLARVRSLLKKKELYDETQALGNQLAKWNQELKTKLEHETKLAEVARSLGSIGHDIKNMLMPILNGAWLLQEELSEHFKNLPDLQAKKSRTSEELSREILEMLGSNAKRIQGQVKEIADCVKGLTTPLKCAPCHIGEVVDTVYKTLHFSASQKSIRLDREGLETLPAIQADEGRLFKAFYNLVNNAIAEVPSGGSIMIRGIRAQDGKSIVVSVKDSGPGMPSEVRDSLFTDRVISRKPGGTGLGTKIVKDAVDAHHGTITIESQLGVGTTFHIKLPI
jgi:signal transduction histidine kinase